MLQLLRRNEFLQYFSKPLGSLWTLLWLANYGNSMNAFRRKVILVSDSLISLGHSIFGISAEISTDFQGIPIFGLIFGEFLWMLLAEKWWLGYFYLWLFLFLEVTVPLHISVLANRGLRVVLHSLFTFFSLLHKTERFGTFHSLL